LAATRFLRHLFLRTLREHFLWFHLPVLESAHSLETPLATESAEHR